MEVIPRPAPKRRKRSSDRERLEQEALFRWARLPATKSVYPGIDLMSCSLNGVKLSKLQAIKAKNGGMLKGEHDIKIPVARHGRIGLSIEMKAGKNKPTPEQLWYGDRLTEEGWRVCYCWSWKDAQQEIINYLS